MDVTYNTVCSAAVSAVSIVRFVLVTEMHIETDNVDRNVHAFGTQHSRLSCCEEKYLNNILTSTYGGLKRVHAFLSKLEYSNKTADASLDFQLMPKVRITFR